MKQTKRWEIWTFVVRIVQPEFFCPTTTYAGTSTLNDWEFNLRCTWTFVRTTLTSTSPLPYVLSLFWTKKQEDYDFCHFFFIHDLPECKRRWLLCMNRYKFKDVYDHWDVTEGVGGSLGTTDLKFKYDRGGYFTHDPKD